MRLAVIDYKHGYGVVDPFHNPQLMAYATGAARKHGAKGNDEVHMIIVQPRADASVTGKPNWRDFTMTAEELYAWAENDLVPAARATEADDAALCAGEHCKFCPAKSKCPEMRRLALETAQVELDSSLMPVRQAPVLPAPGELTAEELGRIATVLDIVEPWFTAVREELDQRLEAGLATPEQTGWKRVLGRGSRKWADENKALAELTRHLRAEAFNRPAMKSVAQAEAAMKEAGLDPKLLAPLWEKTCGVVLAPLADKRPAINPAAELEGLAPVSAAAEEEF